MSAHYGMFIDRERCIGCHACSVACKTENQPPAGKSFMNVKTLGGAHCDTPRAPIPTSACAGSRRCACTARTRRA